MLWHYRENGALAAHEKLGASFDYISRNTMFEFLGKRYNIDTKRHNMIAEITLPGTRARAKIIVNDAAMMIQWYSTIDDGSIILSSALASSC